MKDFAGARDLRVYVDICFLLLSSFFSVFFDGDCIGDFAKV